MDSTPRLKRKYELDILEKNGLIRLYSVLDIATVKTYRNYVMRALPNTTCAETGVSNTLSVHPDEYNWLIRKGAEILTDLGVPDVRYLAGAIIPKYAGEPQRPYHVDWWDWEAPETDWPLGPQLGLIFYLDAATDVTGQLMYRIGSHLDSYAVHETTAPAEAGDCLLIDARLQHAVSSSSPAQEKNYRIAVTLWYLTQWNDLSEQVQSSAMLCITPDIARILGDLAPKYAGSVSPRAHNKTTIYTKRAT